MKKKIAILSLAALLCTGAQADQAAQTDTRYTAEDESPYAELCLAALESKEALQRKAQDMNLKRRHVRKIKCNGMDLPEFARAHREQEREQAIATVQ